MAGSITKTQRWLDLLAFLIGRRLPVAVEQIMEGVPAYAADWSSGDSRTQDSVRRKFERDKDELRDLGIPLETVEYTVYGEAREGYRLERADFYLPYLKLLREAHGESSAIKESESARLPQSGVAELSFEAPEIASALDALTRVEGVPGYPYAAEARSAFAKLSGDFDLSSFREPPLLHLDSPDIGRVRASIGPLTEALEAQKRVAFVYHGIQRDQETEREVEPYALVFQGSHWYLVGRDDLREDIRMFRVSRMREIEPNRSTPHTPDFTVPEDFDLEEMLGREAWELGSGEEGEVTARVRFRFPLSLWAARNQHGELESEAPDGSAMRSFRVRQVHPFLRWLLGFHQQIELLEPPELRVQLAGMAQRVADLHEAGPGEADPDETGNPDD